MMCRRASVVKMTASISSASRSSSLSPSSSGGHVVILVIVCRLGAVVAVAAGVIARALAVGASAVGTRCGRHDVRRAGRVGAAAVRAAFVKLAVIWEVDSMRAPFCSVQRAPGIGPTSSVAPHAARRVRVGGDLLRAPLWNYL